VSTKPLDNATVDFLKYMANVTKQTPIQTI